MGHGHHEQKKLPQPEPPPNHELAERIARLEEKVSHMEKRVEEWIKFLRDNVVKLVLAIIVPIAVTNIIPSVLSYLSRLRR